MSDKSPFILIISEGPHDVETISKILRIKGFRELQLEADIPEGLARIIPRQYPNARDHRLIRMVPHPTFLEREGTYAIISNAGGKTRLGENLSNIIGTLSEETLADLVCIAIVADMDDGTVQSRSEDILSQLSDIEPTPAIKVDETLKGNLEVLNYHFPLFFYLFPDNKSTGTLENLLLDGARIQYAELYRSADDYVAAAKQSHSESLKGFNGLKATVGVIANVFRPGRANQVSIGQDEWIALDTLSSIPSHHAFSIFLDTLCSFLLEKPPSEGKAFQRDSL